jgi:hypothetical protein
MNRMEENEYIDSWQQAFGVAGGEVQRTMYRLLTAGQIACRVMREFYAIRLWVRILLNHPRTPMNAQGERASGRS